MPEIIERGLREVLAEAATPVDDIETVIATLTSQPTPEQIIALHPSTLWQARLSALLLRNKQGSLTSDEHTELARALMLAHVVRIAKARAFIQLKSAA